MGVTPHHYLLILVGGFTLVLFLHKALILFLNFYALLEFFAGTGKALCHTF